MSEAALLSVRGLQAWYGESHVLHGVDFDVRDGEVATLVGRNGAGKTTTLKAIMGMLAKRKGSARFEGVETIGLPSDRIARLGVAICPEERGVFASLTVRENLMLPPQVRPGGLSLDEIFDLFPNLRERLTSQGTKLSGGEQQMLAIARILRTGARLLMLDEPTEGLAPVIIAEIGGTIASNSGRSASRMSGCALKATIRAVTPYFASLAARFSISTGSPRRTTSSVPPGLSTW